MQLIIVEVYVPATSASFDFRLPSTGRVGDIMTEIIRILEATQQNLQFDMEDLLLCDREGERMLNRNDTVAEAGLRDGSRLILV